MPPKSTNYNQLERLEIMMRTSSIGYGYGRCCVFWCTFRCFASFVGVDLDEVLTGFFACRKKMSDRKAVIKNADMSEEMQQEAVDCATQALEKYNIEKVRNHNFCLGWFIHFPSFQVRKRHCAISSASNPFIYQTYRDVHT